MPGADHATVTCRWTVGGQRPSGNETVANAGRAAGVHRSFSPHDTLGQTATVTASPFPAGFFHRDDPTPDPQFYSWPRLVTHIDDEAIAAVGALYEELGVEGDVLDLMASWVSHFQRPPAKLTVLGLNRAELEANPFADAVIVQDLNADPELPLPDDSFDAAVCCVSVDYLIQPVAVFRSVARVVRAGGLFVCTFSNRCFPSKAIRGWLYATAAQRAAIVADYFRRAGGWSEPVSQRRTPTISAGDPLYGVWAFRTPAGSPAPV